MATEKKKYNYDFNPNLFMGNNNYGGLLSDNIYARNVANYNNMNNSLLNNNTNTATTDTRTTTLPPQMQFDMPLEYPDYVTEQPSTFQNIQKLFGKNFPSVAEKQAVYNMMHNMSDEELNLFYLDPEKFKDQYMSNMMNYEPEIIMIDGVAHWQNPDGSIGEQVASWDRPDISSFEETQGAIDQLLKDEETLLDQMKYIEGYPNWSSDENMVKAWENAKYTLNNIQRKLNAMGVPDSASASEINPADIKNISSGDSQLAQDPNYDRLVDDKIVASSDIIDMAFRFGNAWQPQMLTGGGKIDYALMNWKEFLFPIQHAKAGEETYIGIGNKPIQKKSLDGKPIFINGEPVYYTNAEWQDQNTAMMKGNLQFLNKNIRLVTGAVMNKDESKRILTSLANTGYTDDGLLQIVKGDTPSQFASIFDETYLNLILAHVRMGYMKKNNLAIPDLSGYYTYKGERISETELSRMEKDNPAQYREMLNNDELVWEYENQDALDDRGDVIFRAKNGSELTLDSVFNKKEVDGKFVYSGVINDEILDTIDTMSKNTSGRTYMNTSGFFVPFSSLDEQMQRKIATEQVFKSYGIAPDQLSLNLTYRNEQQRAEYREME